MAMLLIAAGDAGDAGIYADRSFLIDRNLAKLFPDNSNYRKEGEADLKLLMEHFPTWSQDLWFHEAALKVLTNRSETGALDTEAARANKHSRSIAHLSIAISLLKPMLRGQTPSVSQEASLRAKEELNRANILNEELLRDQEKGSKRKVFVVMKLNFPMWLEICP
jgi:hypothetical protein